MNWLNQVEKELQRVLPNENPGRTRTTARRVAGIALQQLYNKPSEDFLRLLHTALNDVNLSDEMRSAARRLITRLDANFTSPSIDPINDAMIIVEWTKSKLTSHT